MSLEKLYLKLLQDHPELAAVSFYDHIEIDEGQELYPPFIFVHETAGNPFNADDRTYWIGTENRLDLYSADRSPELRHTIKAFLDSCGLAYTLDPDDFDEETMLYRDSFTVELDD